jgi:hypothetical protein
MAMGAMTRAAHRCRATKSAGNQASIRLSSRKASVSHFARNSVVVKAVAHELRNAAPRSSQNRPDDGLGGAHGSSRRRNRHCRRLRAADRRAPPLLRQADAPPPRRKAQDRWPPAFWRPRTRTPKRLCRQHEHGRVHHQATPARKAITADSGTPIASKRRDQRDHPARAERRKPARGRTRCAIIISRRSR